MSAPKLGVTTPRAKPVISKRNLFREVYFSLQQHHKRVIATVASASIGIFGLVAGIGITRTRDAQTLNQFDALAATQLTARVVQSDPASYPVALPPDAIDRLENINGIVSAGTYAHVTNSGSTSEVLGTSATITAQPAVSSSSSQPRSADNDDRTQVGGSPFVVRATPRASDARTQTVAATVLAVSPGLFPTIQTAFATGRPFTEGNNRNADHVAVIGLRVAEKLGIEGLVNRPSLYIGDEHFEILGIADVNTTKPELVNAVMLPAKTAERLYRTTDTALEMRTSVNATNLPADVLNHQIQLALSNSQPEAIEVTKPSALTNTVRDKISSDLNSGFTFLAALLVALTIATISISTSSAVQARIHEIGLRRALGASRKHIRQQIILEACFTGGIAAIVGTLSGLLAIVYWAHRNQWNVVQDRITIPAALLAGPLLGIVGGIWPAWKASRQEPADTLRNT
jgi:putative ABC transport system permease protein